ncbi:phosphopantetheine-binding protein [Actinosynnema sp. NPDC020468]|uniref:phosphopantetheine-binding protein n=1 Tax=Actinosynnema sp. NPDC020468 TaxID=3154488 RepID=UPI0033FE2C04
MTTDEVRSRIAQVLDIPESEIADDDNLLDHGLDSVRVMSLVEAWRAAGATVAFVDLAETPTVEAWAKLLD